jgi:hypothetical protein
MSCTLPYHSDWLLARTISSRCLKLCSHPLACPRSHPEPPPPHTHPPTHPTTYHTPQSDPCKLQQLPLPHPPTPHTPQGHQGRQHLGGLRVRRGAC